MAFGSTLAPSLNVKWVAHHLTIHSGISLPAYEHMGIHMDGASEWELMVRPHQTRISRNFYARYARKMLLDHFVSKMVAYAQYALYALYALYAPTSLA